jgi:amidase
MNLTDYSRLDGVALAELIRKRQVKPRELALAFVEAVEKVNPRINAIIEVYGDRIKEVDDQVIAHGSFAGVPFLMKDVGAHDLGRRQESGSRLMKGFVADTDSFLTERFKNKAGLKLLGRTTTPEFALGISTESALTGVTRNPWNLELMCGGSSGGSAASVAAGIVPMAHGSDNGGSIRIPASACGLVGLKPSRGRTTLGPDMGEIWPGMLQEFVITRTVRDTALMLDTVSGPAPGDPFIITQPERPFAQEASAPVGHLKIAWTTESWQPGGSVDPEIARCVEKVVAECERAGHELVEISPVFDYEEYFNAVCVAWAFGLHAGLDMFARAMGRTISDDTLEPLMLSFYKYSKGLTGSDMIMTEFSLNKIRRIFGQFFEQYDILLTPTLTRLPETVDTYSKMRAELDYLGYMRRSDATRVHTPPANVTGQPAISLPLGCSQSGLPIGVQFVSRFGHEAALIRLASFLEKQMPWHERIPPVHASL